MRRLGPAVESLQKAAPRLGGQEALPQYGQRPLGRGLSESNDSAASSSESTQGPAYRAEAARRRRNLHAETERWLSSAGQQGFLESNAVRPKTRRQYRRMIERLLQAAQKANRKFKSLSLEEMDSLLAWFFDQDYGKGGDPSIGEKTVAAVAYQGQQRVQ